MSSSTIVEASAQTRARILKNYIGGAWVAPGAPVGSREVVNPATGETIATVPLSGAADVDAAVAAARAAFPGWRSTPSIERARMLFTLRERLLRDADRLARSVTTEMGKTLPDARGEVAARRSRWSSARARSRRR